MSFYNYVAGLGRQTRCSCGRKLHTNLLGCTFSDALEVKRKIHKGQSQYSQLKDAQCSLSCLFCRTPSTSGRSGSDLPGSAFNKIINQESLSFLNEFNASPESFLLEEPPSFIRSVLNGEEIEQNPFEFLGVNRIVVMQESQITENEQR